MDFILGLSPTKKGENSIRVIMDTFTKSTHFLPVHNIYYMDKHSKLYIDETVRLYGISVSFIYDQDPKFTSKF